MTYLYFIIFIINASIFIEFGYKLILETNNVAKKKCSNEVKEMMHYFLIDHYLEIIVLDFNKYLHHGLIRYFGL